LYLVTGSASGIGKSTYSSLKQTDLVTGIDILESDMVCDLSIKSNIEDLVSKIASMNQSIDGVVTCAGVIGGSSVIPLNYFGSVRLIESIYKQYDNVNAILIGSIIFSHTKVNPKLISLLLDDKEEEAILYSKDNHLTDTEVYASCKLALNHWARKFIKSNLNARINVIHPSLTKTGMTEEYIKSEVIKIIFANDITKAYIGGPEEVSDLICYLIKNSKAVNGQSIFVDNGVYEH
jgi:NAD(P)-dependent dehydrogenase (short-subunit alcohol dehydrogenase family)